MGTAYLAHAGETTVVEARHPSASEEPDLSNFATAREDLDFETELSTRRSVLASGKELTNNLTSASVIRSEFSLF